MKSATDIFYDFIELAKVNTKNSLQEELAKKETRFFLQ
jgi:hypothetical protein